MLPPVVGDRSLQRQSRIRKERRPAAHAISDAGDVLAGLGARLQPVYVALTSLSRTGFLSGPAGVASQKEVVVAAFPRGAPSDETTPALSR